MRNSSMYGISGTKTFRLSSRKLLGRHGGNVQNVDKAMRAIYVPDDGKILVQVDQSGAEALHVAYLGRAAKFRTLFEWNVKPHVYVAISLFKDRWKKKMRDASMLTAEDDFDIDTIINTPIPNLKSHPHWRNLDAIIKDSDNWPVDERYYYLAKQTCHSANYGIGASRFKMNVLEKSAGQIVLSDEQASFFLNTYRTLFPEIPEWNESVKTQLRMEPKMLFNLFGEPYTITQPEIEEMHWKELFAWVPQSTVGETTNIAYARMQNYIEVCSNVAQPVSDEVTQALDTYGSSRKQWDLLTNTHDSYLAQVPIGEELIASQVMSFFINMKFVSPFDGVPYQMKSETQAGFNWSPVKKCPDDLDKSDPKVRIKYNLMGLQEIKG